MTFKEVSRTAWQSAKGFKKTFWAGAGFCFLMGLAASIIGIPLTVIGQLDHMHTVMAFLSELIHGAVLFPITAGFMLLAIQHLQGKAVEAKDIFKAYTVRNIVQLILYFIILVIPIALTIFSFLMADIFHRSGHSQGLLWFFVVLTTALGIITLLMVMSASFAKLRIITLKENAFTATWFCFKRAIKHFCPLLYLYLYIIFITLVNLVTIFIFSIWSAPYMMLMFGQYYLEYFAD